MQLLTAPAGQPFTCPASLIFGDLVVDPEFGTALVQDRRRLPVRWPPGYVGRRLNDEVEVIGTDGSVVAVTGGRLTLDGGESSEVWSTCAGLQ